MGKKFNEVTAQPSTPNDTDLVLWGQAAGSGFAYKMTFTQLKAKLDSMGGTTLTAPTLSAAGIDADTIRLTIGTVANETSIEIQRSNDGTTGWSTINTAAANTTSYDDNGLAASTTRHYRVRSVGDGVTYLTSGWSSVANATTAAGVTEEDIVWNQLVDAVNSGGGTVTAGTSSVPQGATASKKIVKANGSYVSFTMPTPVSNAEALVIGLFSDNDADYDWSDSGNNILLGVYQFAANYNKITSNTAATPTSLSTAATAGDVIRLEISGDDVLIKLNGSTIDTATGVLSGVTDIFIRAIFASAPTGKTILTCKGLGMSTI